MSILLEPSKISWRCLFLQPDHWERWRSIGLLYHQIQSTQQWAHLQVVIIFEGSRHKLIDRLVGKNVCVHEPVFKIIRWKITVIPIESTFLRVDSKSQLFPWIQCGIHEKVDGFSRKSRLFLEIVTMKGEGRPYTLLHKECLWIRLKRVDSWSRLSPAFFCFEYRLWAWVFLNFHSTSIQ